MLKSVSTRWDTTRTAEERRYYGRIRVELRFNSLTGGSARSSLIDEGVFEDSLRGLLLNYEQARLWRSRPAKDRLLQTPTAVFASPAYKIEVNQDGIYQVSYSDLRAAGVLTDTLDLLDPHTFKLYNQSAQVAIFVEGEYDDSFDPGDYFLFYGQRVLSKYTVTNVYWLSWDGDDGLRSIGPG